MYRRLVDLYAAGVLGDNAEVWPDPTDTQAALFWTLTDRSSAMYCFEAPVPGYVRIYDGRVRWATTYDGTSKETATLDLKLDDLRDAVDGPLNLDARSNFTLVIKTINSSKEVGIVEGTKQQTEGGVYRSPRGITIIDLARFEPTFHYAVANPHPTSDADAWTLQPNKPTDPDVEYLKFHGKPPSYEQSHAIVQGTGLMTARMSTPNRNIVRSYIEKHVVNLGSEALSNADARARGVFQALARDTLDELERQLADTPPLLRGVENEMAG